mgnify:CR=1 FL=1
MSESVFVGLCEIVGTSQQVAIRRETEDIREMVTKDKMGIVGGQVIFVSGMLSGSYREGFRFRGSDIDTMIWINNYRVIMDMSQSVHYTANTCT